MSHAPESAVRRQIGDKETERQGDKETRRKGDKEKRRQGDASRVLVCRSPCLLVLAPHCPLTRSIALFILLGKLLDESTTDCSRRAHRPTGRSARLGRARHSSHEHSVVFDD